jgi:hypothetical protein
MKMAEQMQMRDSLRVRVIHHKPTPTMLLHIVNRMWSVLTDDDSTESTRCKQLEILLTDLEGKIMEM